MVSGILVLGLRTRMQDPYVHVSLGPYYSPALFRFCFSMSFVQPSYRAGLQRSCVFPARFSSHFYSQEGTYDEQGSGPLEMAYERALPVAGAHFHWSLNLGPHVEAVRT